MVEMMIQNAINNIDRLKELYCVTELETFDIVANCRPNVKAIARVFLMDGLVTEVVYLMVVGVDFDEEFDEINEDDEEQLEEVIITKGDFDSLIKNACKWIYE